MSGGNFKLRTNRTADLSGTNDPTLGILPCNGKVRYQSEKEARDRPSHHEGHPYFCLWCEGWHWTTHGATGERMSKKSSRARRKHCKGQSQRRR
jgi:hypothetical protein